MAASEKQQAALQRAREAKAEKKLQEQGEVGTSEVVKTSPKKLKETYDEGIWFAALQTAMRTKEVKAPCDVAACIPVADEVLRVYKAKFE